MHCSHLQLSLLLAATSLALLAAGAEPPEVCDAACLAASGNLQEEDTVSLLQFQKASAAAVPSFVIDLDLPPEKRWLQMVKYYRTELIAMSSAMRPIFYEKIGKVRGTEWLKYDGLDKYPELLAELKGIVAAVDDPEVTLDLLKMSNLMYELGSPLMGCGGVLWSLPNGTVMHGRNMDYEFKFQMPDGRMLNWPDVTFEAVYHKDGKPLFTSTGWPGGVGVATAMRYNGWTFEQNTRAAKNDERQNLEAAKLGGEANGFLARHLMETVPDFTTAVKTLFEANFMAPQYFIVSGAGAHEGAVLTIDRFGELLPDTPVPIKFMSQSSNAWHLVQTNSDLGKIAADPRRSVANAILEAEPQSFVSKEHLMKFMHTPPIFNPLTVFTTVMIPATGFFKTMLPTDPPLPLMDSVVTAAGGSGFADWSKRIAGASPSQIG